VTSLFLLNTRGPPRSWVLFWTWHRLSGICEAK